MARGETPRSICLDGLHGAAGALVVVGGIDEDLVEDLVQPGGEGDGAQFHGRLVLTPYPEGLLLLLDGSNVCVWAQQHVLQLGQLQRGPHV